MVLRGLLWDAVGDGASLSRCTEQCRVSVSRAVSGNGQQRSTQRLKPSQGREGSDALLYKQSLVLSMFGELREHDHNSWL